MKDTRKLRFVVLTDTGRLMGIYGSDGKMEAIDLDYDTPGNRSYWYDKIGMYADPDIFNLVRKRRCERVERDLLLSGSAR